MSGGLGVALAADVLVADHPAGPDKLDRWCHPLTPLDSGPGWSDLGHALGELRRAAGRKAGALHVALLPPLVQLRRVELPRLSQDELSVVLSRDAGRYLLDPPAIPLVAAWAGSPGRGSPVPYLAAFADADLVASIHAAAAVAGFRTTRVLPAHAAWEAGARRHAAVRRGHGRLLIADDQRVEALVFESGWIRISRRAGAADLDAILTDDAEGRDREGDAMPWFGVVALEPLRRQVEVALMRRGISPMGLFSELPAFRTPAILAAACAPLVGRGELVPSAVRLERGRRERRLSHRLLAGAAAMLVLSAGIELWGAHRELAALEAERRDMRPLVVQAMDLRQTIEGVQERLEALAAAEAGASRWSTVIADVAEHLPSDAHLLSLRGAGDSLVLEGVAARAAGAFESLRRAPGVTGVRAEAPIRQEAQDSAPPVERFTLGARLAAIGAVQGTR